jgi:hypothetical protein
VQRSSGALECDWQLVFGAQVEQDEDGDDVVLCHQASSRTHRPCAVRSLQEHNAALFQATKSSAAAADSAAAMPALYRAELLYMLARQEPDAERKGDADFTEGCARTAHLELCRLRGDKHADTLSCLATLAVLLGKQGKIVEARECFVKCCEGRAATLGRDHVDTLRIQRDFTNFVVKHDVLKTVCANLESKDHTVYSVSIIQFKRTLQACIIAAVGNTVVDADAMGHLVRLLLSAPPSVVEDCAACIGEPVANPALFKPPR